MDIHGFANSLFGGQWLQNVIMIPGMVLVEQRTGKVWSPQVSAHIEANCDFL